MWRAAVQGIIDTTFSESPYRFEYGDGPHGQFLSAIRDNNISRVRWLYNAYNTTVYGFDLNSSTFRNRGIYPLELAMKYNYNDIVRYLLDRGANPNLFHNNKSDYQRRMDAKIRFENIMKDESYTEEHNKNQKQFEIALSCIEKGYLETLKDIVEKNSHILLMTTEWSESLLMVSAKSDNLSILKYLVEKYRSVHDIQYNWTNTYGEDAFMLACKFGKIENVKVLFDDVIYIDRKNIHGDTALMIAIDNSHTEVVRFLLMHGASKFKMNNYLSTPKAKARRCGNKEIRRMMHVVDLSILLDL